MATQTDAPQRRTDSILLNEISWGAVLAGVVIALVTQLLLNMLGIGIGVATLDPMSGNNPEPQTFSVAAALWWTVSGIVAAFFGGYAAGRMAGRSDPNTAAWHGFSAWALTTLVVFALMTATASTVIGGVYNLVSGAVGGLGRSAQAMVPAVSQMSDPFANIEQSLRAATGGNDPAVMRDAAVAAVRAALTGDPEQAEQARERAAQALARAQNIPVEDARTRVREYEMQYRTALDQARQQASEAADAAATAVSRGALFGFIALALGALAGWFGGYAAAAAPASQAPRGVQRRPAEG